MSLEHPKLELMPKEHKLSEELSENKSQLDSDGEIRAKNKISSPLKSAFKSPVGRQLPFQKKIGWNEAEGPTKPQNMENMVPPVPKTFNFNVDSDSSDDLEEGTAKKLGDKKIFKEPEGSINKGETQKEWVIERTRIEKNWLRKKSREEYMKFLLNAFHLNDLNKQLKETRNFSEKEHIFNEIKELGKESNFYVLKNYNDKYVRANNPLRDKYLLLPKPGHANLKFVLQKFGKRFGKMLYRHIEMQPLTEDFDFSKPFAFDSDELREHKPRSVSASNSSSMIKSMEEKKKKKKKKKLKIYDPPKNIIYETKPDYLARKEIPIWLKYLLWINSEIENLHFRLLLIYSDVNSKENKAIYFKTAEEAKKAENYFRFLMLKNSGYDPGQKFGKFMTPYKTIISRVLAELIPVIAAQANRYRIVSGDEVKPLEPEKAELEFDIKEKRKAVMTEISDLIQKKSKEAIVIMALKWKRLAFDIKKDQEERKKFEVEKKAMVFKILTQNSWMTNLNTLMISELFFQEWLSKALAIMKQEKDDIKISFSFRLDFLQIETPKAEWMDLFKPMILISGQFMPEKYIAASPSHSPLKTLFLKKNDSTRKKNSFSLNSMDCFLQKRMEDKLLWDISPDNQKSLKSTDLEVMECIFIEFLDEGAQNNESYQKGKSHRIVLSIEFLRTIFKNLRTKIFWIPLKSILKVGEKKNQLLFMKVVNSEFISRRNEGLIDEIYGVGLNFPEIEKLAEAKSGGIIDKILKVKFDINMDLLKASQEEKTFVSKIKEKYDELSLKSYWQLMEQFLDSFFLNPDDYKTLSHNGLPNIFRRKLWGIKNREKYREVLDYCLNKYLKIHKEPKILGDDKTSCFEIFQKLLSETKTNISFVLLSQIEKDMKDLFHSFSADNLKTISNIFQSLLFWAHLMNKKLIYSKSLLNLVLKVFQAFSKDLLQDYYLERSDVREILRELSGIHSKFEDLDLIDSNRLASDCFWALIAMISEFFPEYYLIDEGVKDSINFNLNSFRGTMITLRIYLQEFFPHKISIFEQNEGSPYGFELLFGEWFLDLMSNAGFRGETLYRLWDSMFYLEEFIHKKVRVSYFVIGVISLIFKKFDSISFKNYQEFRKYLALYMISLENTEEFLHDAFQETIKVGNFLEKKWHIWVDIENQMLKTHTYYRNYAQMTNTFLIKSENIKQAKLQVSQFASEIFIKPKFSLHLFIYGLTICQTEPTFLIEIAYNSISKLYRCNELQKDHLSINLYDNFPFDPAQKSLSITIFKDFNLNFMERQNSQIQTSDEDLEDLLFLHERSQDPCQKLLLASPLEDCTRLFSLKIDVSSFIEGILHKNLYKMTYHEKTQDFFSSEIEVALLISESEFLKESYFKKSASILNSHIPTQLQFSNEKKASMNEIAMEIYENLEKLKHDGSLASEQAGNIFFLFEDSYEYLDLRFHEFLSRMNSLDFHNDVAVRWIHESLKLLSVKEKRNRNNAVFLPEFAASFYLFSPEKSLKFLFKDFSEKIPISTFKLFLRSLYNFLGFPSSHHYIENFLDFYLQNLNGNASINKAFITIGEPNPKNTRFDVSKLLIEYMIYSHTNFGSKETLLGLEDNLNVLKEMLKKDQQFTEFSQQLTPEKYALLTVKYRTTDGLHTIKTIKFNNKWEVENSEKEVSMKPNENIFYKFKNSLSFNSFVFKIDYDQAQQILENLPLLNYFISFRNVIEYPNNYFNDLTKPSKIRVEININGSLLLSIIAPIESQALKLEEKNLDYMLLASNWKNYTKNKLNEFLKEEIAALEEEEEDLSEKNNNEFSIEILHTSIFSHIKSFILKIQSNLMTFFQESLENINISFFSALKNCRALFMMDFFRTRLRLSLKQERRYFTLQEITSMNLANIFQGKKIPILVIEYLTPNINLEVLKHSQNSQEGYIDLIYPKQTFKKQFSYQNLAFFRFPDHSGEWLDAEIYAGKLREKERKHLMFGQKNEGHILKKDDFAYFQVCFKKWPEENFVLQPKDVRIFSNINFSRLVI